MVCVLGLIAMAEEVEEVAVEVLTVVPRRGGIRSGGVTTRAERHREADGHREFKKAGVGLGGRQHDGVPR